MWTRCFAQLQGVYHDKRVELVNLLGPLGQEYDLLFVNPSDCAYSLVYILTVSIFL
jgi:hypothetical protein